MATEEKVEGTQEEVTEVKEVSETEKFKAHIQRIIFQETGKKVSKSVAWNLYKAMIHGSFEYTLNMEDNKAGEKKLPLSGVCTFEVINTKPRVS